MGRFWRRVSFDETEDPYAAPARYTGDDPAPRGTLRRARQNSLWVYLVGLPFLLLSVPSILEGDPSRRSWCCGPAWCWRSVSRTFSPPGPRMRR